MISSFVFPGVSLSTVLTISAAVAVAFFLDSGVPTAVANEVPSPDQSARAEEIRRGRHSTEAYVMGLSWIAGMVVYHFIVFPRLHRRVILRAWKETGEFLPVDEFRARAKPRKGTDLFDYPRNAEEQVFYDLKWREFRHGLFFNLAWFGFCVVILPRLV